MKRKLFNLGIFVSVLIIPYLFLLPGTLTACTAFTLKRDNQVFLAKNLDWKINKGIIIINKKGVSKTAYCKDKKKLSWISRYGSVTFNQFGKEFPLGGMNEEGLVIEELNSWGDTPKKENKYNVNEFQWTQFCLDNFANVRELLESTDSIVIVPLFINLHYLISDSYGNTAIIEFYNGKSYKYHGDNIPYPILSNNHYENSLKYLGEFRGFGGNLEIKPDNTSNERFVKVASMLRKQEQSQINTETSFKILDYVSQEDTQWSIVYDISNRSIHYKTSNNSTIKSIELMALDFTCKTPPSFIEINNNEKVINAKSFKKLEPGDNRKLLNVVYNSYKSFSLEEIEKPEFLRLAEYGNSVKCK